MWAEFYSGRVEGKPLSRFLWNGSFNGRISLARVM